jgi:hypothetical protein
LSCVPPQPAYGIAARPSIDAAIKTHLTHFVGSPKQVKKAIDAYFATIHLWFPIVTETTYRENLTKGLELSTSEINLLALCMTLINIHPGGHDILDQAGPLYSVVKSSIAILESIDVQSLRLVQTRLLLSLFEVGHGLHKSAFISLGSLARSAALIGINRASTANPSASAEYAESEGLNVWWGIVILDRYGFPTGTYILDSTTNISGLSCPS